MRGVSIYALITFSFLLNTRAVAYDEKYAHPQITKAAIDTLL